MSSRAMSLKGRINDHAKKHGIAAQVVLQNYMFERFLERLSRSPYQEKFVIKGGMLVAAIVGLDTRSTMDLDTTLRDLPLTEDQVNEAVRRICGIDLKDGVEFRVASSASIRKEDRYGGFRLRMDAVYDTIATPLSIDISTGDVMTPSAVSYEFSGLFDKGIRIRLWGYNIETVMAEKAETILSRGVFSTRPRDYYDIYILAATRQYDKALFLEALTATAEHRGSAAVLSAPEPILEAISASPDLRQLWRKYQKKFPYAHEITYEMVMNVLHGLISS